MSQFLFDPNEFENRPAAEAAASEGQGGGVPRLRLPHRDQVEIRSCALDHLVEPDHAVRVVWEAVCRMDLSRWLDEIRAVERHAGRNATDPRLLVALWLMAVIDGIASARELADMCKRHVAYQWLCGGVTVNHHMLSDFRSQDPKKWDHLFATLTGSLMAEDLVKMHRVAQDGMRVRASAGKSSFRRRSRLEQCLEEAREQVEALRRLAEENPEKLSQRKLAARERAAAERQQRIEAALRQCDELQSQREATAKKSGRDPGEARASTTDPEARTMKFPNGGYGPGFNVQFSTDTEARVIVGVDVTNAGSDNEELPPMLKQIKAHYGRTPDEALVDGGFASKDAIEEAEKAYGCKVYAPLKDEEKQRGKGQDPHARKKGDSDIIAAWRERMGTGVAKAIYKLRCQTAEWVNAVCRNRGLWQMPIRGLKKCRTVAVLYAITHNLLQAVKLRAEAASMTG